MASREKLLQKFTEEYNRLNSQQRKAVDTNRRAGNGNCRPGTGKTQILSARIGKILMTDTDAEPENILCLTYTDAGVVAMRKRLAELYWSRCLQSRTFTLSMLFATI